MGKITNSLDVTATGTNIKRLMKDRNITAKDMGKMLGISSTAVCKYTKGKAMPSVAHLVMMAQILNVATNDILVITG